MTLRGADAAARYLAAIVESSDDAIVSKDLNGIIQSWNPAAERTFGYSAAEAIGRSITIIIPHARLSEEDFVLSQVRAGNRIEHFETIRQRKDGTMVPIALTVSPIRSADGRVIGVSKIARNIAEQKRAEAALHAAQRERDDLQQRLLTLVAASASIISASEPAAVFERALRLAPQLVSADGYAIWRFSDDGSWKPVAYHGLSPEFAEAVAVDSSGRPVQSLAFTEPQLIENVFDSTMVAMRRSAYQREGIASMLVVPLMVGGHGTGTLVFYFRTRHQFSPAEVQAAQALGNIVAAATSTAEIHTANRTRQEQSEFLARATAVLTGSMNYAETLKEVVSLAVPRIADWCAVDLVTESGEIERIAVAHVDREGMALGAEIARRFLQRTDSPHGTAAVLQTGEAICVPRITDAMVASAVQDDQQHLAMIRELGLASYMCVPLATATRRFGALIFAISESARPFTPDHLAVAKELAVRAAMAIENAKAYQEARQANHLKDAFLATLSHELRTPLNAILGYAQMLEQNVMAPERRGQAVSAIRRNATALGQMVEDVLDVSRMTTGKLRLHLGDVDVSQVIAEAIESLAPVADQKHIAIKTDAQPLRIEADHDRLKQVVWNLLSNAVKFTGDGGEVHVSAHAEDDGVVIAVRDTGHGIPPELLRDIFEPFRQGDAGRETGGLGLGLAIARRIVELHRGTISVESPGIGQGATFRVIIPGSPVSVAAT